VVPFRLDLQRDTVRDAPLHEPLTASGDATVRAVLTLLRTERRGAVLVCSGDALEGIFTERDAVRLLASGGDLDRPVREEMSAPLATVDEGTPLAEAMRSMSAGGYRRLPVLDESGRPVALLKVTDLVEYLVEHVPDAVHTLPPTPHPRTTEREGP